MNNDILLDVQDLVTQFKLDDGILTAVDHVSFSIRRGETLGVVGESGCGKSVTAFSILNLVSPPGKVVSGKIMFEGENLLEKSKRDMKKIRGERISMIFQEPMTSLNPVFTVGNQIDETLRIHKGLSRQEAKKKTIELLRLVNIPLPEQRYEALFEKPLHPYTEALLKSIPHVGKGSDKLYMIEGMVPNLLKKHEGCLFAPRCQYATDLCRQREPELLEIDGRQVRCHRYTPEWGDNK